MIKRIALAIFTLTFLVTTPVFAETLDDATLDFFDINGIYYYDPNGALGGSCVTGSNTDYSGKQVLSEDMSSAIQSNQAFYKKAAEQYGFDWRILAVVHIMEHNASRSNPDNGQGAYQLYSYTEGGTNENAFLPPGPISDEEFQRQSNIAAEQIYKYGNGLDLSSSAGVKTLFFKYNGAAEKYVEKALAMGFSEAEAATGEGSPYVMNRFDARRDPTNPNYDDVNWPGMYVGDGVWDDKATMGNRPGAYTIYVALGGADDSCYVVGSGGGRIPSGVHGMTLEEAQRFMEYYKEAVKGKSESDLISQYGMTHNDCTGGIAYNCVSFSRYFINMYVNDYITNHITVALGDGGVFVDNLLSGGYEFSDGGSTPAVYAIFSTSSSSSYGHTGVVLGLNTDDRKIIIGQAACGQGEAGIQAFEADLGDYMTSSYRYAYPRSVNTSSTSNVFTPNTILGWKGK